MKITITIKEKLYKDLKAYCNLNDIDIETFCNDAISKELMERKYGDIPFGVVGKSEKKELPEIKIDESKIPTKIVSTEIIPPDRPFSPSDGTSLLIGMDEVTSVTKIENKEDKNENKDNGKNKKRRL